MKYDDFSIRMKEYENVNRNKLVRKIPVIIRCDGKAFHTLTRRLRLMPFDDRFIDWMVAAAKFLCENVQGCKIAYVQSDEISLFLNDYEKIETSAWFDYNIQKLSSVSASMATHAFNKAMNFEVKNNTPACFDSRAFNIPKEEVVNYFYWRQKDCIRNSVLTLAQSNFSHKSIQNKNVRELREMLNDAGCSWESLPIYKQRGVCVIKEKFLVNGAERHKWMADREIPEFRSDGREYVSIYV